MGVHMNKIRYYDYYCFHYIYSPYIIIPLAPAIIVCVPMIVR